MSRAGSGERGMGPTAPPTLTRDRPPDARSTRRSTPKELRAAVCLPASIPGGGKGGVGVEEGTWGKGDGDLQLQGLMEPEAASPLAVLAAGLGSHSRSTWTPGGRCGAAGCVGCCGRRRSSRLNHHSLGIRGGPASFVNSLRGSPALWKRVACLTAGPLRAAEDAPVARETEMTILRWASAHPVAVVATLSLSS